PLDFTKIDGSLPYRCFPRLPHNRLDIASRARSRSRKRLTNYSPSRRLVFLDLLLPLLRTVEPAFRLAVAGRARHSGASRRLFSRHRLFRIALFNGAARFSLLERDRIARRANFGCDSRYPHVGDPNRRLALRACAAGEKDLGARLARIDEGSRLLGE